MNGLRLGISPTSRRGGLIATSPLLRGASLIDKNHPDRAPEDPRRRANVHSGHAKAIDGAERLVLREAEEREARAEDVRDVLDVLALLVFILRQLRVEDGHRVGDEVHEEAAEAQVGSSQTRRKRGRKRRGVG